RIFDSCSTAPRDLHPFPTRRSSDLGFVASVMDAVRREATVPPPIPFPWKRALPGLAVAGLTLGLVLILSLEQLVRTVTSPSIPADRKSTRLNSSHDQISYAVFCLKK